MRFLRIRASAYGQLDDALLAGLPADRAAVILGDNEAGKSTWFHAFNTALYGFSPAHPDRFPYRSWTVSRFPEVEAELVAADGRHLKVHRRLMSQPQGVLEQQGQTIRLRNRPLDEVAHVGRSLYETLYALRLEDLAPLEGLPAEELRDRLLGQAEWTALRAPRQVAAELEQEAARLWRSDRRGKPHYRTLQAELQQLQEARRHAVALEAELRLSAKRILEARSLLAHVEEELALTRARLQRAEEWLPLQRRLSAHAAGLCEGTWTHTATERLRQLSLEDLRHAITRCEAARHRLQECEALARADRLQPPPSEQPSGAAGAVVVGAIGALLGVIGVLRSWGWLAAFGALLVGGAGWLGMQRMTAAQRLQQREQEYAAQQQEIAAQLEAAQNDWSRARSELGRLVHGIPIAPDILDVAEMGLYHQIHRLRAMATEAAELERELARQEVAVTEMRDDRAMIAIAAGAGGSVGGGGSVTDGIGGGDGGSDGIEAISRLRLHLERLEEQRDELHREIGRLEQQLLRDNTGPSVSELDGEIASLEDEMRRIARQRDRLLIEAALLREAEHRFLREHQPDVLKRASAYLQEITGGKYDRLLGESGSDAGTQGNGQATLPAWGFEQLAIIAAGDAQAISLQSALSRGTLDQVYLALRLAVIDHLDADEEPLPFLIDEALVHWDRRRLKAGLQLLGRMAATRQILLFTCHPWLAEAAVREMDAQVFPL